MRISVVMPAYNSAKYIRQAIESILKQTFNDFEFIIINDGSNDDTENIIRSYDDRRIVYIKNDTNLGLSKSFNIGIKAAQGEYIARMDADDISLPDRFKNQVEFFEKHQNIDIIGSSVVAIDEYGRKRNLIAKPLDHKSIKWQSLFSTPLIHPTVMARTLIMKENPFDESFHNSEDYELWSRLLFKTNTKFANLAEPQLLYRVYQNSFTKKLNLEHRLNSARNTISNIETYIKLSENEKDVLIKDRQDVFLSLYNLIMIIKLYSRAAKKFREREKFNPPLGNLIKTLFKRHVLKRFAPHF